MYTAYVLSEQSREKLAKFFPPRYERFIGHHVTVDFGVPDNTPVPDEVSLEVISRFDTNDGLEAFVVIVGGTTTRPDGKIYHLTWSLDPDKYKPVDSNTVIAEFDKYPFGVNDGYLNIPIEAKPALLK